MIVLLLMLLLLLLLAATLISYQRSNWSQYFCEIVLSSRTAPCGRPATDAKRSSLA
jgi:uncharacterized membrane protein affecting hemolysin expression